VATLAELQARLDALRALRARGIRRVSYQGQEVEFRSDAEMASAIADLERQVAALSGRRVSTVYINASKGV
jgi:hypothetical protein